MKPRVAIDGRLPKAFGLSRQELKRAAENFVARSSARSGIPFREVTVILQDDASSAEVHLAVNGAEGKYRAAVALRAHRRATRLAE